MKKIEAKKKRKQENRRNEKWRRKKGRTEGYDPTKGPPVKSSFSLPSDHRCTVAARSLKTSRSLRQNDLSTYWQGSVAAPSISSGRESFPGYSRKQFSGTPSRMHRRDRLFLLYFRAMMMKNNTVPRHHNYSSCFV